jgi:hypothetical protein
MLVTGLVLAFVYEWRVALVVLAVSPLIGVCGWLMAHSMNAMSHAVQDAYGKAGGIATEALTAVRTVSSFGLDRTFAERYEANLDLAVRAQIRGSALLGCSSGGLLASFAAFLAVGVLYGSSLIADEHERSAFGWVTNQSGGNLTFWCSDPNKNTPMHERDTPCPGDLDTFKMTCGWARVAVQYGTHEKSFGFDSEASFRDYCVDESPPEYVDENRRALPPPPLAPAPLPPPPTTAPRVLRAATTTAASSARRACSLPSSRCRLGASP